MERVEVDMRLRSHRRHPSVCALGVTGLVTLCCAAALIASPAGESRAPAKPAPVKGDAQKDVKTRQEMAQLFTAMRTLLPLAVDDGAFEKRENKAAIEDATARLRTHAAVMSGHVQDDGPGTRFLGARLARDAREVDRHFRAGRIDQARYLVQEMTDTCIACHARLPADVDSPLSESFVSTTMLQGLPLRAQARVQLATRRFDDALSTLEKVLLDESVPAAQLIDSLSQYLTTSIRVKGDFDRPVITLEKFLARKDMWRALRRDVQQWILSLAELKRYSKVAPDLKTARRLIDDATNLVSFRSDRTGLVHVITASSLLFRFIDAKKRTDKELAEAYYFLGVAESLIRQNYWLEEAEAYLEISIRLDPKGPWADVALAKLEEETLFTYTGSDGQPLPEDVERHLDELRALVGTK
jgi:tetratricopeptide (TPR) repeat protein